MPTIDKDKTVVSNLSAQIFVTYDSKVRVQTITLYYKEALYKGLCEKEWNSVSCAELNKGVASHLLRGLQSGCSYRIYAVASNTFGDSPASKELRFRTFSEELDLRIT